MKISDETKELLSKLQAFAKKMAELHATFKKPMTGEEYKLAKFLHFHVGKRVGGVLANDVPFAGILTNYQEWQEVLTDTGLVHATMITIRDEEGMHMVVQSNKGVRFYGDALKEPSIDD